MIRKFKIYFVVLSLLFIAGCASVNIKDYQNTIPKLEIESYFSGKTKAWGVFQDRFGKVRRQFVVDIHGDWDPETKTLKLTEDFVYDDGEKERRIWTIVKTGSDTYTGTADGVIGTATGQSAGNAFNFKYAFRLPVAGSIWNVRFDDWMFLQNDETLFNKATVTRFGVKLGDVYIFFRKEK